jgi:sarcosine oxidase
MQSIDSCPKHWHNSSMSERNLINDSFDVIVVGLGAMGSAAVYQLVRRGVRTLGLDRFRPPHIWGSSHSQSRIIRQAYHEHPAYVPLVQRAYASWTELERESGQTLFRQTGGLMIGPPGGELVDGALKSVGTYDLPHELLSAADVRGRYPIFSTPDHFVALWEPRAGVLFPEACIGAQLELARQRGALLHYEEPVVDWCVDSQTVYVTTPEGHYQARQLVLSAGAWLARLVSDLRLPLVVERQVLYWFEPVANQAAFQPENCPVYLWEYKPGCIFYGFPDLGTGVKVALHHQGEPADPDTLDRTVGASEQAGIRGLLERYLPDANGQLVQTSVCMYTNAPDHHFIIDSHPAYGQVLIASPCSGHGFKFSAAIGEIIAELLTSKTSPFDLNLFRLERLVTATP